MSATGSSIAHSPNSVEQPPAPSTVATSSRNATLETQQRCLHCSRLLLDTHSIYCDDCREVSVQVSASLSFNAPRALHDFAQTLANKTRRIWFVGVGPDGAVLTNDREGLLAKGYDRRSGRNHYIAWIPPQGGVSTVDGESLPEIPPYEKRHSFAYSLWCSLCRTEQIHTLTQHCVDIAISKQQREQLINAPCRHDYRDGDLCSKCDQIRPQGGAR